MKSAWQIKQEIDAKAKFRKQKELQENIEYIEECVAVALKKQEPQAITYRTLTPEIREKIETAGYKIFEVEENIGKKYIISWE